MAKDSKKNAAYDSGIRGKERAPKATASQESKTEDTLPSGATRIEIVPADNGFIINCSYPPKRGSKNEYLCYVPPKPKVFTSAEDAADFVLQSLKVDDKK